MLQLPIIGVDLRAAFQSQEKPVEERRCVSLEENASLELRKGVPSVSIIKALVQDSNWREYDGYLTWTNWNHGLCSSKQVMNMKGRLAMVYWSGWNINLWIQQLDARVQVGKGG